MRNIAAVKPCSMFRLTIPLVAGIFVSDHFFQGALPVLVSGTGILGCLIGLIVLMKWQGYHGFYVSILCRGIVATAKMATGGL